MLNYIMYGDSTSNFIIFVLKMYLIFNISNHNFKISALFVLNYYFLMEIYINFI